VALRPTLSDGLPLFNLLLYRTLFGKTLEKLKMILHEKFLGSMHFIGIAEKSSHFNILVFLKHYASDMINFLLKDHTIGG
jgi:hypothetical protein